jgi:predicted kinase
MDVIIFIGLQGAGKSTFYQKYFATTHVYISKDQLTRSKTMNKDAKQSQLLAEVLQAEHSVVIDNTNPTSQDRTQLIRIAHSYNATVIGYYFDASVRECLVRNRERSGKAQVPDKAIYITAARMVLPNYEEGFDMLFRVYTKSNNVFEVAPFSS